MATGTTKYGDISPRTAAYASREFLKHADNVAVLQKFGMVKEHPKNMTDTVKFRRWVPFDAATVPLVEGVTPSAQQMSVEDVTVQLKQYGAPIEITDVVEDLHEDPVLQGAMRLAGQQAGHTMEMITFGVVRAGTNVFYTNGSARNAVNTVPSLNKQRAITRALETAKAMKITQILDGSPDTNTSPIEAAYIACCHSHVAADIRGLAGFVPVAEYGARKVVHERELGSVEEVRYITSPELSPFADAGGAKGTMISTTGTSADVYVVMFFGQESFGLVPLKGKRAVTPRVINPNTVDKSDPMGQRGYVSWKTYFAAVRLNETWMARLECAATDL